MSYCRFSNGDLYIIHNCDGYLECYCGQGKGEVSWKTTSRQAMITHIRNHMLETDNVQQWSIDRLVNEIREEGDKVL